MTTYKTISNYGYFPIDEKPPKLDMEALYLIIDCSIYYPNCVIIERTDKETFMGYNKWIVDRSSLIPIN